MSSRLPRLLRRFSKFGLVGASGVAVNMSVFWALTSLLRAHYLLAGPIAIEVALCSNYLLNNNWTFADRRSGFVSGRGLARYHVVSLGGMLINLGVLQLLVSAGGLSPLLANLCGIGLATAWNFTWNLRWTWRLRGVPAVVGAPLPHASLTDP